MQGAVFDLPADEMKQWESTLLFERANDSLTKATTLPELEEMTPFGNQSTGGQRWGGRGGYGRGNFGRGGLNNSSPRGGFNNFSPRGGYGGNKRSFGSSSNDAPVNKRQKFD